MDYSPSKIDLDAIKTSDGSVVKYAQSTGGTAAGCTLGASTYVFPLGEQRSVLPGQTTIVEAQLYWAAAVTGTITFEVTNFPATLGMRPSSQNSGGTPAWDVKDWDVTTGLWIPLNPTNAYVPVVGSGNSAAGAIVTAGGTNAGGCVFTVAMLGSRRARIKLVLSPGGLVRCAIHGKDGGGDRT